MTQSHAQASIFHLMQRRWCREIRSRGWDMASLFDCWDDTAKVHVSTCACAHTHTHTHTHTQARTHNQHQNTHAMPHYAEMVTSRVQKLRLGDGLSPDTTTGPLITAAGVDKVEAHVQDAVRKGAQVCVWVCACECVYVCVFVCECVSVCVHVCTKKCSCVIMDACMCMHVSMFLYDSVCICNCIHVWMCVGVCTRLVWKWVWMDCIDFCPFSIQMANLLHLKLPMLVIWHRG